MDTASSDADGLTYFALDNGPTIESLAVLNRDLKAAQLPNVTVGEAPNVTLRVTRRTALHRWWDHEVMVCHLGGISFTNISSSSKSTLPHFEPKMLAWARDTLGASGVIRAYAGLKYLDMPIVKGHISASYWNEEFCDDTRLLLTAANIPERGGIPAYFATLDALRDYFLDDANDFLARDLAECTMLEFLVEGIKVYHELAEALSVSTSQMVVEDIIESSRIHGWGLTITNIRNVVDEPQTTTLRRLLEQAANAKVTTRSEIFHNLIKSEWYECSEAVVSMMKCRAVVLRNGEKCIKMANCLRGNQWFSRYYDCDICDDEEINIEVWTSLCGFSPEIHNFFTSEMSEYLKNVHLASDTSGLPRYKGKSYSYRGLSVSTAVQYDYMETEPSPIFDISNSNTSRAERMSLLVNDARKELIVVRTSMASRLKRFIDGINVTLKLPIIEVSKQGRFKEGSGPGPNSIVRSVMRGKYGKDAIHWLLSHLFAGNLQISSHSPFRGFLPRHCLTDSKALVMVEPLKGYMLQEYKVLRIKDQRDYKYYWAPQRIGNVFEVIVGYSVVRLRETSRDIVDQSSTVVRMASHKVLT